MSQYPDCYESSNVICKHVRASITVYVNLDSRLPANVTVVSATAESADESLVISTPDVIDSDTVVEQDSECGGLTLLSGRALRFTLADGTIPNEDADGNEAETIIVVGFVGSDSQEDFVDCRLIIGGTA